MGGLSGRSASLGVEGRDGALLAIELSNEADESDLHFDLAEADDASDPAAALATLNDLGVIAVVGPMTSTSAVAVAPMADELGIALLSPTTSTDSLTGRADHFLRLYPSNDSAASELLKHAVARFGPIEVAAIYDVGNSAHTETWLAGLKRHLGALGGVVTAEEPFTSGEYPNYSALARAVIAEDPDCVFILANAIDTALLCQRIRVEGSDAQILASEWSSTDDLIENGGRAVDGMLFIQTIDRTSDEPAYLEFVQQFRERFGYEPGFAAVHSFNATQMVMASANAGATRETMRDALINSGPFPGLQATINLDQYGDVEPTYYLMTVADGVFAKVDQP